MPCLRRVAAALIGRVDGQMEVSRNTSSDGWIAARRCIEAMAGQDDETRRSLWRAAVKYMQKYREGRAGLEVHAPLAGHAQIRGARGREGVK